MKTIVNVFAILLIVVGVISISIGITVLVSPKAYITEKKCKQYIVDHKEELVFKHNGKLWAFFTIDSCELNYFTDVSVRLYDKHTYDIIFWGDRDSWQWDYRLDKHFSVDTHYEMLSKNKTLAEMKLDVDVLTVLYTAITKHYLQLDKELSEELRNQIEFTYEPNTKID